MENNKFRRKAVTESAKFADIEDTDLGEQPQALDITAIKAYEKEQKAKALAQTQSAPEELMEFDQWWAMRFHLLSQPGHLKDILRADAKGRKLNKLETLDRWDWAARAFGLKF